MKILVITIITLLTINAHSKPVMPQHKYIGSHKTIVYSNSKKPLNVQEKIAYRQSVINRIIKIDDEREALIKVLLQLNLEIGKETTKKMRKQ